MPSRKPRMALTLPEHVNAAVHDLADAMGKPASKVVTELLEEMVPQLEGLAKIARAGKAGNKAAAKRALQHMMGDQLAEVMAIQQPELLVKKAKS
jgi:predicted DNA-binding protein